MDPGLLRRQQQCLVRRDKRQEDGGETWPCYASLITRAGMLGAEVNGTSSFKEGPSQMMAP